MASFVHHDLRLLNPAFASPLVDTLTELEHLRKLTLAGDTPPPLFFQLKSIFHVLESLGSARIEGNHTTLADYVESRLEGKTQATDQLREVANIENAMEFIEQSIAPDVDITEYFIRQLHTLTVRDLEREGDRTPGVYRLSGVTIAQSAHLPPDAISVSGYMTELVSFINRSDLPKYDLMKIALAHHRFGWIHPFSNGNGRVVRLLTFALLVKYGFNVQKYGRVLNPTAVFCNDRELYYSMLAQADTGKTEGLERWCTYVLQGILQELRKVDQLTNFSYLRGKILEPAIAYAKERQLITSVEAQILLRTTRNGTVKSADLVEQMPALNANQRTYQIRRLIKQGMLLPVQAGARIYSAGFANSFLIRGVIQALFVEKFIPDSLVRP